MHMKLDHASQTAEEHRGIEEWVAKNIGGRVTRIERQRRWRPVWRVDVEKDGEHLPLVFKGMRAWDAIPFTLEHEYRMLEVLAANGIPVPPLHGMCDYPEAFVMTWVTGGRDPGLVVEAIEKKSEISPDRWQASLEYMEILAKMHSIPPEQFEAAGCRMPVGNADINLNFYERFYELYQKLGISDPFMEFCTGWLRRNVPAAPPMLSFVTGDCGQFLSDGPKVTAVIDVEVGHLGDHFYDLACFRGRHPVENMGDIPALYAHYAKALGQPLDLDAIAYHTVSFLAMAVFTPLFGMKELQPGGDWVEGWFQVALIARRAMEAMAEIVDVELDDVHLPPARKTPIEDLAINKLIFEIDRVPLSDAFADWQRNTISAIPAYLRNAFHYGVWVQEQELDELEPILGYRPQDAEAADKALTEFVLAAGPEHDKTLIRLFHRRFLRHCLVIAGPNPPADHIVLAKVQPILHQ